MNTPNIPEADARFAKFFSRGSQLLKKVPPLDWLIVGDNTVPDGWQHIEKPASEINSWVTFEGDPRGPRLPIPRLYRMVGVLAVQKSEMQNLQERIQSLQERDALPRPTRQAVALRFGGATVIGALAEGSPFAQDPEDEDLLLVAPRIARGDMIATTRVYLPLEHDFIAATSTRSLARVSVAEAHKIVSIA